MKIFFNIMHFLTYYEMKNMSHFLKNKVSHFVYWIICCIFALDLERSKSQKCEIFLIWDYFQNYLEKAIMMLM